MQDVMNILYFVHDLLDPAVRRRVTMLEAGGASVTLAGFQRGDGQVHGAICLGRTRDGAFAQRLGAVGRASLTLGQQLRSLPKPDIIIARNLEMLALAKRARASLGGAEIPVVYECLDIHRLLLRDDAAGSALRKAERWLARDIKLLLTSSPAFVDNYFQPYGQVSAPALLLENKLLNLDFAPHANALDGIGAGPDQPWKIGWFGALRCRKSLGLLAAVSRAFEGQLTIVLRGRPALTEFDDFHGLVAREPFMSFEGAYKNPEDIASIYGDVHFAWAVDFFEEGQNSSWLLPNRLYEGCRYGAVPIAMSDTQVGRYLAARGLGVLLKDASADTLRGKLSQQMAGAYGHQRAALAKTDPAEWVCSRADCTKLVDRLRRLLTDRARDSVALAMEKAA